MRPQSKRVFISDLPESLKENELKEIFNNYGEVLAVEIKKRKELGPKNKSFYFAYLNLNTTDSELNKCFKEICNKKWHGEYLQLQLARESFLDRLKKEREEAQTNKSSIASVTLQQTDTTSGKEELYNLNIKVQNKKINKDKKVIEDEPVICEEISQNDIVIKNNRTKTIDKNKLNIPSFGKEPVNAIPEKVTINDSESNLKRLQSLQNMKKEHKTRQNLIKEALSNLDKVSNKKITFSEEQDAYSGIENEVISNGLHKKSLFDDDSDVEQHFKDDFKMKKQFEGGQGQKLLELQSRYKNDRRFMLDERFIEDEKDTTELSEETLEAEKNTQLKILEEVIGKKIKRDSIDEGHTKNKKQKIMIRYDPNQPDHTNLEIARPKITDSKKKKKLKEETQAENVVEEPIPEVSKDVFYKVTDNLKETFQDKQQFSLLSTFGKVDDEKEEDDEYYSTNVNLNSKLSLNGQNPFKYDSSDGEDDIEDIPHKEESTGKVQNTVSSQPEEKRINTLWTEPFFFKHDDYRLQEGLDFLERIKTKTREFTEVRRELKGIVKAKVRNNARKNKMFKRKLGGNRKKTNLRLKKALKR